MTRKSIVQLLDNTQVHCATLDTPHNIKLAIMIYLKTFLWSFLLTFKQTCFTFILKSAPGYRNV